MSMCTESPIDSAGTVLQRQTLNGQGDYILPDYFALTSLLSVPCIRIVRVTPLKIHRISSSQGSTSSPGSRPTYMARSIPYWSDSGKWVTDPFHMIKPLSKPYISLSYCG